MSTAILDPNVYGYYSLGGALIVVAVFWWRGRSTRANPLDRRPPGPKGKFLIKNLRQYPRTRAYEWYTEARKQYGDLIFMQLPGLSILTLSSLEDVEELLVKRANVYSGRPPHTLVNDLMDFNWSVLRAQPGHAHNENRKIFRKVIGAQSVTQYDYLIEQEATGYVQRMAGFSGDPLEITQDCVGAVVIKLAYGENLHQTHGQELIKLNTEALSLVTWAFGKPWLPNFIPITRYLPSWFPGIQFPKYAFKGKEMITKIRHWAFGMVLEAEAEGRADASVITRYLHNPEIPDEYLRDAIAMMYMGGVDTTSSALLNFIFFMLMNPGEQKKIQKELDTNIGRSRTPNMKEVLSLRYLNAAWRESLRMMPPVPLGVPHLNTTEDTYKGYYIPKGTLIQQNIGYMMRDPNLWGEYGKVDEYDPGRFLPEVNPRSNKLPDVSSMVFGFGRRICPGRYIADRSGMLFAAAVLSNFDILPVEGEELPAVMEFVDQLIRRPANLRCRFAARR